MFVTFQVYFTSPTIALCQSMGALMEARAPFAGLPSHLGVILVLSGCPTAAQRPEQAEGWWAAWDGATGDAVYSSGQPSVLPAARLLGRGAGLGAEPRGCRWCGLSGMLSLLQQGLEKVHVAGRPPLLCSCLPRMETVFSFIQNRAKPHPRGCWHKTGISH